MFIILNSRYDLISPGDFSFCFHTKTLDLLDKVKLREPSMKEFRVYSCNDVYEAKQAISSMHLAGLPFRFCFFVSREFHRNNICCVVIRALTQTLPATKSLTIKVNLGYCIKISLHIYNAINKSSYIVFKQTLHKVKMECFIVMHFF